MSEQQRADIEREALIGIADRLRKRRLTTFIGTDIDKGLHYAEAVIRAQLAHPDLPAIEDDPVAVRLDLLPRAASVGTEEGRDG